MVISTSTTTLWANELNPHDEIIFHGIRITFSGSNLIHFEKLSTLERIKYWLLANFGI